MTTPPIVTRWIDALGNVRGEIVRAVQQDSRSTVAPALSSVASALDGHITTLRRVAVQYRVIEAQRAVAAAASTYSSALSELANYP